ncbi:MAG: hypothetical protein K2N34_11735, partial [Lachnospiraceae bacterium]|nr:hypothetical protein [Lachnospiraceae bacterium]
MSKEKCPACHLMIPSDADVCPGCGLKNLNQIFWGREDYEERVENILNPYLEKMTPRVYAGCNHVLILTGKGALYGIGKNDSGQLGIHEKKEFTAPHLLARNVKSAAAGYDYSIYVTNEGEVKLLGIGEYAERFKGFSNAEEVFARNDRNVFWIKDANGQIYAFGENIDILGNREPHLLYQFSMEMLDVTYIHEN